MLHHLSGAIVSDALHCVLSLIGIKQHLDTMHNQKDKEEDDEDDEEEEVVNDTESPPTRGFNASLWIPKKLLATHSNTDGIRCIAAIFALTGGCAINNGEDIEVSVVDGGTTLALTEECTSVMTDMSEFYSGFPHNPREQSSDDHNKMRFAMMDAARLANDQDGKRRDTHFERLPFKVDPTEMRVKFVGMKDGSRMVHVELAKRKKIQVHGIVMMDNKRKSTQKSPATKYSQHTV